MAAREKTEEESCFFPKRREGDTVVLNECSEVKTVPIQAERG